MFMDDCSSELEDIRLRINCREFVTRCLLALSAASKKMLCCNLANEKVDRLNLMHLLFDKHKLLDYEDGVFKEPYPTATETFHRMTDAFGDIEHVQRMELPERPTIYLFEVQRREQDPLSVVWEKRDSFYGEDEPYVPLTLKWHE